VSTLLVAAILGPEAAGAVFVADRTTRVVLLALTGINQALAPELSSAYYTGDQAACAADSRASRTRRLPGGARYADRIPVLRQDRALDLRSGYATTQTYAVRIIFSIGAPSRPPAARSSSCRTSPACKNALLKYWSSSMRWPRVTAVATYYFGSLAGSEIAGTLITWNIISVALARRGSVSTRRCWVVRRPAGRGPP